MAVCWQKIVFFSQVKLALLRDNCRLWCKSFTGDDNGDDGGGDNKKYRWRNWLEFFCHIFLFFLVTRCPFKAASKLVLYNKTNLFNRKAHSALVEDEDLILPLKWEPGEDLMGKILLSHPKIIDLVVHFLVDSVTYYSYKDMIYV